MLSALLLTFSIGSTQPALSLPVLATQDEAGGTPPVDVAPAGIGQQPDAGFNTSLSFDAGFTWQFQTNMNEPGEVSHGRFHTDGNVRMGVAENLDLVLGWRYQYDHWNFSETPTWWKDINTVQLDLGARWRVDDHWMIFGGGQVMWSVEERGSWSRGIIGGGAAGISYAFSKDLIIGGGLGVRSQLEDSALFYPIVVLDWQITDRLSLDTRLTTGWANQSGAELVYELTEELDLSFAVVFDYERFRLDSSGPVPGGVGTTEALPLALALTWEPYPDATISIYAGATVYGRIKVTDSAQNDVFASTYDPAAIIGFQGAIRF